MNFHYCYLISHIIENKFYIGVRSCYCIPKEDIGVQYFSSSRDKSFKLEQKEYPDNFEYQVLQIFNDRISAMNYEIYLHNSFDVGSNPLFYNRCKASPSGFDLTGKNHSEETKKKMSKSAKLRTNIHPMLGKTHSEETKKKISKNRIENKISKGKNNTMYNKNHSEESKKKMSKSAKLRTNIHPMLGKTHSKESKMKNSLSQKGRKWFVNSINENFTCFSNDERLLTGIWQNGKIWKENRGII